MTDKKLSDRNSKLVQLSEGRWLVHNEHGYFCGEVRLPPEDAIGILVEHVKHEYRLERLLKKKLPEDDYSLLRTNLMWDRLARDREEHEKWIIEMLELTAPPDRDWDGDWEQLHRIAVSPCPIRGCIVRLWETFSDDDLWKFAREHKPDINPLRKWQVVIEWEVGTPARKTEDMWAYSPETVEGFWSFHGRRVISMKEVRSRNCKVFVQRD